MPLAKPKTDWPVNATSLAGDRSAMAHAPSPARALQQLLDERTSQVHESERWSRRRQIAFIVVSTAALWAAIIEITSQTIRAIA